MISKFLNQVFVVINPYHMIIAIVSEVRLIIKQKKYCKTQVYHYEHTTLLLPTGRQRMPAQQGLFCTPTGVQVKKAFPLSVQN